MTDQLYTVSELAAMLGQPESRVRHALATYKIDPSRRAGIARLFSGHQVAQIRAAVSRVAERAK